MGAAKNLLADIDEHAALARAHARRSGLGVQDGAPDDWELYHGLVADAASCACRLEGPHPGEARHWWLVYVRQTPRGRLFAGSRHFDWTPEGHARAIAAWAAHQLPPGQTLPWDRPTHAPEIGMPGDGWLLVSYQGPGRVEVARTGTGERGRARAYRLAGGAGPSR